MIPKDIKLAALYIVRGQPRRQKAYRDAMQEINSRSGAGYISVTIRGRRERVYLPKNRESDPAAWRAAAVEMLAGLAEVKTMQAVDAALREVGKEQPKEIRRKLQNAVMINSCGGEDAAFTRLDVPGFSQSGFYRERDKFLLDVAERCGIC